MIFRGSKNGPFTAIKTCTFYTLFLGTFYAQNAFLWKNWRFLTFCFQIYIRKTGHNPQKTTFKMAIFGQIAWKKGVTKWPKMGKTWPPILGGQNPKMRSKSRGFGTPLFCPFSKKWVTFWPPFFWAFYENTAKMPFLAPFLGHFWTALKTG